MSQPSPLSLFWTIAKHELLLILKTRRAFAATGLYVISALLGSFIYIYSLRKIEQALASALVEQGSDPLTAASTVGLMSSEAYEKTLSFFVGHDLEFISEIFRASPLLPLCLWGSLAFLPLLILVTSFDQTVNDIHSRSICYSLLRISRRSVILGKVFAHAILTMALIAVCFALLLLIAMYQLENIDFSHTIGGFVRIWVLLLPFGLCYISLTSLASTLAKSPFGALGLSAAFFLGLKVLSWFQNIAPNSSYALLRHLRWLSPNTYTSGLWLQDPIEPFISSCAYLCLSAAFLFLGIKHLEAKDL